MTLLIGICALAPILLRAPAPDQGGVEKPVLNGYYVDLTALAREYGWQPISSWDDPDFSWTWHFKAFEYWHYQKTDGLPWYAAMQEVYAQTNLDEYFTYHQMLELGDYPFLIALKGIPLPAEARLWSSRLSSTISASRCSTTRASTSAATSG